MSKPIHIFASKHLLFSSRNKPKILKMHNFWKIRKLTTSPKLTMCIFLHIRSRGKYTKLAKLTYELTFFCQHIENIQKLA